MPTQMDICYLLVLNFLTSFRCCKLHSDTFLLEENIFVLSVKNIFQINKTFCKTDVLEIVMEILTTITNAAMSRPGSDGNGGVLQIIQCNRYGGFQQMQFSVYKIFVGISFYF